MAEASDQIPQPPINPIHIASHVPVKLTGKNYLLWKSKSIPVLKTYDLFNILTGEEPCPPKYKSADKKDKSPAYNDWRRKDQACRVFIYATISEDLWLSLDSCSRRSHAMWLKLEENFLKTRILDLKKGKQTITEYLNLAEEIADGLAAAGFPVNLRKYVAHVLHGLPSDYDDFGSRIWERVRRVTREEFRSLLLNEESNIYRRLQTAARIMPLNEASISFSSSSAVQQAQERRRPWPELRVPTVPCLSQMLENRKDYGVILKQGFSLFSGCALVYGFLYA